MIKIRATSTLKLTGGTINITITYQKGASLSNIFTDLLPMLVNDVGADELKKRIDAIGGKS